MTNLIPIFPLDIVAYPTETVSLHIFEPRYIQLINDCFILQKPFGIPIVINGIMQEIGTQMQITSIEKKYENGEMDIRTLGLNTFNILEIINDLPDKLYKGAIVSHLPTPILSSTNNQKNVIALIHLFHQLLNVKKTYKKSDNELTSFDIAHHVGFSLDQEYQFLEINSEAKRFIFLLNHLKEAINILKNQKNTVERINLNGDFRNLSLDDFQFKKY